MKRIMIAIVAMLLVACSDRGVGTSTYTDVIKNEPGLAGCKVYRANAGGMSSGIYITRCPNSTTNTQWKAGKTTMESTTIEEQIDEAAAKETARLNALSKLSEADKQALGLLK